MTLIWEEAEKMTALTNKNGVGVWPNASTSMPVESRSRSRSCIGYLKPPSRTYRIDSSDFITAEHFVKFFHHLIVTTF